MADLRADLKKTVYYFKRNGLVHTVNAARERLMQHKGEPYHYESPDAEEVLRQQRHAGQMSRKFSIVVPLFNTPKQYLEEMITSVINQTYPHWELILADASDNEHIRQAVEDGDAIPDERIRYIRLSENRGIAENTNAALSYVTGEYVGLLDHDDILTADALYENAVRIEAAVAEGRKPLLLFSDEDKCNGEGTLFYEPHRKEKFNLDLLLSNNYICHFMVLDAELLKRLGFRSAYDGAQDYDLVLRVADLVKEDERLAIHIPRVLYHWRCHETSTAQNPRSKDYAYEAGKRAVQDFADRNGIRAEAVHTRHLGFYNLRYGTPYELLAARRDVGAVGGCLVHRRKRVGGRMNADGTFLYDGLPLGFSGSFHRAVLLQDAEYTDIRAMIIRGELREVFARISGISPALLPKEAFRVSDYIPTDADHGKLGRALCEAIRAEGYRIVWKADWMEEI